MCQSKRKANGSKSVPAKAAQPNNGQSKTEAMPRQEPAPRSVLMSGLLLLLCVVGIYMPYLYQGIVQERILKTKVDGHGVPLPALNYFQHIACFLLGAALSAALQISTGKDLPSYVEYWKPALSQSFGPAIGIQAMRYIGYPAQVIAKSSKMVPTMITGTLVYKKQYAPIEYGFAGLIAAGVALFAYKPGKAANLDDVPTTLVVVGYVMCMVNLFADGYTNSTQDEILRRHKHRHPLNMMAGMNLWGSLYYSLAAAVFWVTLEADVKEGLMGVFSTAQVQYDLVLFCLCGAVGQVFIFATIAGFGSLTCILVCTTRKFFSILLSTIIYGHPLSGRQWVGTVLVFSGVLASQLYKQMKVKRVKPEKKVS